jgi:hypothetical protein
MALTHVGSFTLLEINIGLAAALGFLNPLALQLDLMVTGAFGLGPFLADVQAQFNAAVAAIAGIQFNIAFNALGAIQALIAAFASLQASLQVALGLGLPAVSLSLTAQLSATAALAARLQLQLGGIKALIAAAIALKIPAVKFIAELVATLNLGPVHLLSFTGSTLAQTGVDVAAEFATGLGPTDPIASFENVEGLILVTKNPSAFVGIQAILLT